MQGIPERVEKANYTFPITIRTVYRSTARCLVFVLCLFGIGSLDNNGTSRVRLAPDMVAYSLSTIAYKLWE